MPDSHHSNHCHDGRTLDALFRAIASSRRRHILRSVRDGCHDTRALARQVVAVSSPSAISTLETRLAHVDVPILLDVGLLERGERGLCESEHPAWSIPIYHTVIDSAAHHVDDCLACFMNRHSRAVVAALEQMDEPIEPRALARAIARFSEPTSEPVAITTRLHHIDLPRLAAHDCVIIDDASGEIHYRGDPLIAELVGALQDLDVLPTDMNS